MLVDFLNYKPVNDVMLYQLLPQDTSKLLIVINKYAAGHVHGVWYLPRPYSNNARVKSVP